MTNSLLIFGTQKFNNSFNEIKEHLDFSLIFFKKDAFVESSISSISLLLVDSDVCEEPELLYSINKIKDKPILLLHKPYALSNYDLIYNDKITLPLNLTEISDKIINLLTSVKFNKNSSIKIKDYVVDKNIRILKKGQLSIVVTEREIQLIEILFNALNPISKNLILKKVWKYSADADTHTVETHIYRLRKKILKTFKDDSFIINTKSGYSI
tara:strand:- start:456 stop:1091 length:636 start_codon:yes stop_codon:yes gene_type:complete